MWRAAFLPWPTATVTVRSDGTMSPPAKMPGRPVIMSGPTLTDAVLDLEPGRVVEQRQIDVLAQRQHHRIGLQRLEFAGRLRKALLVELHLLDRDRAALDRLDGRQPLHHHAFLQRLLDLEIVRRHLLARAAVDDDGLAGAEPLGGARDVDGGVAAAVDHHAAAQQRLLLALHRAQHGTASSTFARRRRPECRRAWRCARRPRERPRRSRRRASSPRCRRPWC